MCASTHLIYALLFVFLDASTHEECPGPPGTWAIMKKLSVHVMQEHHIRNLFLYKKVYQRNVNKP